MDIWGAKRLQSRSEVSFTGLKCVMTSANGVVHVRHVLRKKPLPGVGRAAMQHYEVNEPLVCIATDIVDPLPITNRGNQYIIVLGDYYSK